MMKILLYLLMLGVKRQNLTIIVIVSHMLMFDSKFSNIDFNYRHCIIRSNFYNGQQYIQELVS